MVEAVGDVYRVHIDVNDHPCFLAPPGWHETKPWIERLRRPLVNDRPEPPLVPRTVGVDNSARPSANFQAINFGQEPAVDSAGREFLERELGSFVEFYALPPHASERWLAETTSVVDCLDEKHSDWRGQPSRSSVYRYAFRVDVLAGLDVDVFVLPQWPYSSWFCKQRFVDRFTESDLTGLRFDRVMRMPGH